ncbi:LUD domain-containing protein [Allobranchiibius sp. GilTou38]|uniref:LutC/YkgG family protein n=1 Tax=Allobranchiibius sp. GilTou38 TaxID=2815210 RepID=UPI001AA176B3|nr:LUD domain-containing protein [Allobranchiibius sp. GilTou38]MBO1765393.1 LUD domain-containing protein [Allobranchiibius sp. GilTou38]
MDARETILQRVRTALADRPAAPPVVRDYHQAGSRLADVDVFVERVADYRATVHRCGASVVQERLSDILRARSIMEIAVPRGFPTEWVPTVRTADEPVSVEELDRISAVLTTCCLGIEQTGTIVLDAGPGQGPRVLTLVPDYHLVVVREDQVVAAVPDAVAALDATRPQTWISGPSATSDIELQRVEGVHGPRTLDVLLVASA